MSLPKPAPDNDLRCFQNKKYLCKIGNTKHSKVLNLDFNQKLSKIKVCTKSPCAQIKSKTKQMLSQQVFYGQRTRSSWGEKISKRISFQKDHVISVGFFRHVSPRPDQ